MKTLAYYQEKTHHGKANATHDRKAYVWAKTRRMMIDASLAAVRMGDMERHTGLSPRLVDLRGLPSV
jgi:hypothetical protein